MYISGASNLSWKLSFRAEDSSPKTPGINLIIESQNTAAASSPPDKTKSPIEISLVTKWSLTLWSTPL